MILALASTTRKNSLRSINISKLSISLGKLCLRTLINPKTSRNKKIKRKKRQRLKPRKSNLHNTWGINICLHHLNYQSKTFLTWNKAMGAILMIRDSKPISISNKSNLNAIRGRKKNESSQNKQVKSFTHWGAQAPSSNKIRKIVQNSKKLVLNITSTI